jgi:hypothetical protein
VVFARSGIVDGGKSSIVIRISNPRSAIMLDKACTFTAVVLVTLTLVGCSDSTSPPAEIQAGQSREEVLEILGEPNHIIEFVLPEGSFFGPQESLSNLLPASSTIEEWQYLREGEIQFVWFWGESATEEWTVVLTQTYPSDAVY